jgi:hypothetical protein
MTVPGRVEAAELLVSLDPPGWFVRHARGVAEVAGWLAGRIAAGGRPIDRRLVETAALLHDVDKVAPPTDALRRAGHGAGSAAWLADRGHPELGAAVTNHPVTRLAADDVDRWLRGATIEERIVAYADKRVGQRLEPMAARFASWQRRYPGGWSDEDAAVVRARAERLEADVCRAAGVEPDDVRRLRWTGPALAAARRGSRVQG